MNQSLTLAEKILYTHTYKEAANVYERGKDKAKFLEELSHISTDDAGAFTLKLADSTMSTIRKYKM